MQPTSADAYAVLSGLASSEAVRVRDAGVNLPGGPALHALDHDGRLMLLLPLTTDDPAVDDDQSRGVSARVRSLVADDSEGRFLAIKCELPALGSTFAWLSDDILTALHADPTRPSSTAVGVLDRWRDLLGPSPRRLMSEGALLGFLAELRLLERLIREIGGKAALAAWTGPKGSRHDFTTAGAAVEVKGSTSRDRVLVEIHGLEQLETPEDMDLYLWVERMERTPAGGDSVPDALSRISGLGVSRIELLSRAAELGYSDADQQSYAALRFRSRDHRCFLVSDGFPRLVPSSLKQPELSQSLIRVRYTLDLTETAQLTGFIADPDEVVRRVSGGS